MPTQLTPSLSFVTSPIVEIVVGKGDNETVMTAHKTILMEAPFLAELVNKFEGSGSVSFSPIAEIIHSY